MFRENCTHFRGVIRNLFVKQMLQFRKRRKMMAIVYLLITHHALQLTLIVQVSKSYKNCLEIFQNFDMIYVLRCR